MLSLVEAFIGFFSRIMRQERTPLPKRKCSCYRINQKTNGTVARDRIVESTMMEAVSSELRVDFAVRT